MHFNLFISMKYPPPGNFFVVSLVIFNQIFLLDPGICWQVPFTLDGNFASYFSCWPTIGSIRSDWSWLSITRRAFNDSKFNTLVSGFPHVHQPPHPILKHRSEYSIICADKHTSHCPVFEIDTEMAAAEQKTTHSTLVDPRHLPRRDEVVNYSRKSPFRFRTIPWLWGVR